MRQSEIAKTHDVSESFITLLKKHSRFTDNLALANEMAAITGRKPINFISKRVRNFALAAHPELGKKVKKVTA